jgi:hypothetical protein
MTNKNEAPPQEFFLSNSGSGSSPWEIQRPQKTILELVKQGLFHGQVLDVGCGIADNAIYIATHTNNIHLTAIDLVNLPFFFSEINKFCLGTKSN